MRYKLQEVFAEEKKKKSLFVQVPFGSIQGTSIQAFLFHYRLAMQGFAGDGE